MFKSIIALCLAACISATPLSSSCPDVKVLQNLNVPKCLGRWYELESYPSIFQLNAKCTTADYSASDDGKIKIVNRAVNWLTGITETIVGYGYSVSATEAKFVVTFPTLPVKIEAPYWVIDTDCENYSLVWSCQERELLPEKYAWILTREPKPSDAVKGKIEQVIKDSGIDRSLFKPTSQDNCSYE